MVKTLNETKTDEEELPERWRGDPEGFERWLERTGYYEAG